MLVLHLILGLFSFAHVLLGSDTCGCLGAFRIDPMYTLWLNAGLVALFAFTTPGGRR